MAVNDEEFHPFRVEIPEQALAELRDRLNRTRWTPDPEQGPARPVTA